MAYYSHSGTMRKGEKGERGKFQVSVEALIRDNRQSEPKKKLVFPG